MQLSLRDARGDEPAQRARLIGIEHRSKCESSHRRRQKENRCADNVGLEGTEVRLSSARQVLRRQEARNQQSAQRLKRLELRAEARDFVHHLFHEVLCRQLFVMDAALAAPRTILVCNLSRAIRAW